MASGRSFDLSNDGAEVGTAEVDLDAALQGVAHAARAADLAARYAAERRQGRGPDGGHVDQHADVARMIAECDALAIGGRALCHVTLVAHELSGEEDFVEFMTPVCKYFCTEAGIRAADLAIQVMGGYGYLREYRAEQNWRDARICSIYECSTASTPARSRRAGSP